MEDLTLVANIIKCTVRSISTHRLREFYRLIVPAFSLFILCPVWAQGQNWHLEYGPKQPVVIYSLVRNSFSGGPVTDLQLMLADPPVMPGRQDVKAYMHVDNCTDNISIEGNKPGRSLLYEHLWFQPGLSEVNYEIAYKGTLQSCRIVPGSASIPVPALTHAEEHEFLRQNGELNFKSTVVKNFMERNGLLRRNSESDIDLAWRFFRFITQRYHYGGGPKHILSKLVEGPGSDCGGISEIFTGMCRFSGIPARLLVGRIVLPNTPCNSSYHCQSEFYVPRIGWIPVDATYGLQQGNGAARFFGNRKPNFLVCEYDVNVPLEQKDETGKVTATNKLGILQLPTLWVGGASNINVQSTSTLQVIFL